MQRILLLLILIISTSLGAEILQEFKITCMFTKSNDSAYKRPLKIHFLTTIPGLKLFEENNGKDEALDKIKTKGFLAPNYDANVLFQIQNPDSALTDLDSLCYASPPSTRDNPYFRYSENLFAVILRAPNHMEKHFEWSYSDLSDIFFLVESVPFQYPQEPEAILLSSSPSNAEISLGFNPFKKYKTPYTFHGSPDKIRKLTIKLDGYQTVDTTFSTAQDSFKVLHLDLIPEKRTELIVDFDPIPAEVSLNFKKAGNSPLHLYGSRALKQKSWYYYSVSEKNYITHSDLLYTDTLSTLILKGSLDWDKETYEFKTDRSFSITSLFLVMLAKNEVDCYIGYLNIKNRTAISFPLGHELDSIHPDLSDSVQFYTGLGFSILSPIIVNEKFWISNLFNYKIFWLLQSPGKLLQTQLTFRTGLSFLSEYRVEYNKKGLIYGHLYSNPHGSHLFKEYEKNTFVPAEFNLSTDLYITKNWIFSFNGGAWFLLDTHFLNKEKFYYKSEINIWQNDINAPTPQSINKKIYLSQQSKILPYFGITLRYKSPENGKMKAWWF